MKLFQYVDHNEIKVGAVIDGTYIDLKRTTIENGIRLPYKMEDIMQEDVGTLLQNYKKLTLFPIEDTIDYAPVVDRLEKIVCIGLNYVQHIEETHLKKTEFPTIFPKFQNSLIAHDQIIHLPQNAYQFDYEAELVIVIKKECKKVSVEEAKDYIFGYSVGNDFSARDLQLRTSQWMLGKACDDFAPVGPYIVTADECDSHDLNISCRVNGELVQKSNTKYMIYNCEEIVSYVSQYITLRQNDLIFTGTPAGVILGKEDKHWLKTGDEVQVTIEGIGTLHNKLF